MSSVVTGSLLVPIPDDMSYEHASMACCGLGATFTAMTNMAVSNADTVLVTGLGPVGLGAVINAVARGSRVIGAARSPGLLRLACERGGCELLARDVELLLPDALAAADHDWVVFVHSRLGRLPMPDRDVGQFFLASVGERCPERLGEMELILGMARDSAFADWLVELSRDRCDGASRLAVRFLAPAAVT